MKNLIAGMFAILIVFPTTPTPRALEADRRADEAMPQIHDAVMAASGAGRHYVYFRVKPYSGAARAELLYRLEKLGFWCDRGDGLLYIGW